MNVGYYFHVGGVVSGQRAAIPAHYGVFLSEIARQAGSVTHYLHRTDGDGTETWELGEGSLRFVDLGPKGPNPLMGLLPTRYLGRFDPTSDGIDVMLVRAPTALLPGLARRCRRAGVPVAALLVADYRNWRPMLAYPWWRNQLIRMWLRIYRLLQSRALRHAKILAISSAITAGSGSPRGSKPLLVRTSAFTERQLAEVDASPRLAFPEPEERPIRLLFTGRLVEEKGLFELVDALAELTRRGHDMRLALVGYTSGDPTVDQLRERAQLLGIADLLEMRGFKPSGPELLAEYQRSDIYVLPTYGEGAVPRTVKEAFACRVPVVTTAVPAILESLEDGCQALLISPRSPAAIVKAVERLIAEPELRSRLAAEARKWVGGFTSERSVEQIVRELAHLAAARATRR